MAVREVGTLGKLFTGESSDPKPFIGQERVTHQYDRNTGVDANFVHTLTGADLPGGSEFIETDTGNRYRWNGAAWVLVVQPQDPTPYLARIDATLTQLHEYLVLKLGS